MQLVKIRDSLIGKNQPCFISLEAGGTWTNFENAKKMIEDVGKAGANAIKFQTFLPGDSERILEDKDLKVKFSNEDGEKSELIKDVFKRRELTKEQWSELVELAKKSNLAFISTPIFPESVDFLVEQKIDAIKIAKGDINNVLLINYASKNKIPIILDGREKFSDVDNAIKICKKNDNNQIIIMHCPSGYPAESSGVHLNAIKEIKNKYDYPVGFSDHSPGDMMNYAAIAMGASMLEKTITSDKKIDQVEHSMSLELREIEDFVKNIRILENAMGNGKILYTSRVSEDVRRSLVAKLEIKKGQKISWEMIDYKRPGNMGISVSDGFQVQNKIAKEDIKKGEILSWGKIENP